MAPALKVISSSAPSRYDTRGALPPGDGHDVARPNPSIAIRTRIGAVESPTNPKARSLATINRTVDILEKEFSQEFISQGAYQMGRLLQALLEKASGARTGGGDESQVRAHPADSHELRIGYAIQNAGIINAHMDWIASKVGEQGMRTLRDVLTSGTTFAGTLGPMPSEKQVAFLAARFRAHLEGLAESWQTCPRAEPLKRHHRAGA